MARGESVQPSSDRSSGIAIWAVFGVACLLALFLVVWATSDSDSEHVDPYQLETEEPFIGAEATMEPLGWRDAVPVTNSDRRAQLHESLTARGYTPAGEWSELEGMPLARPFAELHGGCGVVALATDDGSRIDSLGAGKFRPNQPERATVGACGSTQPVRVEGSGLVSARVYLMPGITEQAAEDTGVPPEVILAHAEAELLMAPRGWTPTDDVIHEEITSGHGVTPPEQPSDGCVPWVVVGYGVTTSGVTWLGRLVDSDPTHGRAMLGMIGCAGSGVMGARQSEIYADPSGADPGGLWFRPYAVGPAPATAPARAVTITEATFSDGTSAITLPRAVEDRVDD